MTGNIRNGLGLLVFAALAALVGFTALAADAPDAGAMILLGGAVLAVIGLLRIGADLLGNNTPQRD